MAGNRIRRLQSDRFLDLIKRVWENPFYRKRWASAGLEPGDRIVALERGPIQRVPIDRQAGLDDISHGRV